MASISRVSWLIQEFRSFFEIIFGNRSCTWVLALIMNNFFELVWCENSLRYLVIPESDCDVPTGSATVNAFGSAIASSREPNQSTAGFLPNSSEMGSQWVPPLQTVDVHGFQIDGMVYVGTVLRSVSGQGIEPSLINPVLSLTLSNVENFH
jgi:hypothetical protein